MTAVLLLVAQIVSPGVCDACLRTGCDRGDAASASEPACPACIGTTIAAVADSGCRGTPLPGQRRGGMEAGDGPSNCRDACRCMLAPRHVDDQSPPVPPRVDVSVDTPIAAAASGVPFPVDPHRVSAADLLVGSLLPARAARVLFGVWRN